MNRFLHETFSALHELFMIHNSTEKKSKPFGLSNKKSLPIPSGHWPQHPLTNLSRTTKRTRSNQCLPKSPKQHCWTPASAKCVALTKPKKIVTISVNNTPETMGVSSFPGKVIPAWGKENPFQFLHGNPGRPQNRSFLVISWGRGLT